MVTTATDWFYNTYHVLESDNFCLVPKQKINANTITYAIKSNERQKSPSMCGDFQYTTKLSI